MKKVFSIIIISSMLLGILALTGCNNASKGNYLASDETTVSIFSIKDEKLVSADSLPRGTKVIGLNKSFTDSKTKIKYIAFRKDNSKKKSKKDSKKDAEIFYVASDNFVDSLDKCVKETTLFVRTPTTLYANTDDPTIAGFVKKGTQLEVTGFDKLDKQGNVNMYQVKAGELSAYAYGKYLAHTEEEANSVNTEYFELNKNAVFSYDLLGGDPKNLDYFPFDKTVDTSLLDKEKEFPLDARTYYLNAACLFKNNDSSYVVDNYIELAKQCGCNAFVIDIEDGYLAYQSELAKNISPTSYNSAPMTMEEYKESIDRIKEAGIWAIGRIVCFKDPQFATDYPDECIIDNGNNTGWPSAYSRKTWEYKVKLAQEAVLAFGFDEIQFDYVRFPENAYALSSANADFKNVYGEDKAETVQNFCMYAADNIHKVGAYFSVDVFGECANGYVTAYGQYWPAISNVVDAISGMPYIDHFGRGTNTWQDQYATVYNWGVSANISQTKAPTFAVPRTWITCYDVPYWNPYIKADATFLSNQIRGLWDAGIGYGGFLTWNGQSNLNVYYNVAPAFLADYS